MRHETVTVERFYKDHAEGLDLELLAGDRGLGRVIRESTVNRPGLALAGFTRYFASKRIQVLGSAETSFMKSLAPDDRLQRFERLLSYKIPCFVFSRSINPDALFLSAAEKAEIPVFKSPLITMRFINRATLALELMFAPHGMEMGSMVDVMGIGVIIRGVSGIGKSESVLALIERGYSLVSDDATRVTLLDGKDVVGTSPEVTRNHMEVRGIGIVNVAAMFGIRSIRSEKRVDLVLTLKAWSDGQDVDRLGLEEQHVKILGVKIPHIVIPVRPGRDLARLIEVAAFQTKLKATGFNPAEELNKKLIREMTGERQP